LAKAPSTRDPKGTSVCKGSALLSKFGMFVTRHAHRLLRHMGAACKDTSAGMGVGFGKHHPSKYRQAQRTAEIEPAPTKRATERRLLVEEVTRLKQPPAYGRKKPRLINLAAG